MPVIKKKKSTNLHVCSCFSYMDDLDGDAIKLLIFSDLMAF